MSNGMDSGATGDAPSAAWRQLSSVTMFGVGALCRTFLFGLNYPEIHGLEDFMEILDSRRDTSARTKGLLTGTASPIPCLLSSKCANMTLSQFPIILACTYVQASMTEATPICASAGKADRELYTVWMIR